MDAELALGRHALLVAGLTEQVRNQPLDERPVAQLMVALYRSGRQADALAAYAAAARRLDDELGVEPGPELRRLQAEVLRQDEALTGPARLPVPAQPGRRPQPGLRPATPLIGRQRELATAVRLLTGGQTRLVTLLGPGGMGKTRLATAVVEQLATGDREVVVVQLAAVTDPTDLLPEICRAAGATPDWAAQPAAEVAVRRLGDRDTLLVLDNLEQLVGTTAALDGLVGLLADLPRLVVLATSRTALRVRGEHLLLLGPLPLPDPGQDGDPAAVLGSDAVRLFADRAAAALPGFEVTARNAATVAELCRMLDGLPLALELAAARARVLPPEEMLARVGNRLRLLTGGARDLPERQRSIRATLDWSFQLLEPDEARLFAQLSVFCGGWSLDAVEQVCGSAADGDPLDLLDRLVDRSLVVADGSGRMSMLGTVREYAAEMLADAARRPVQHRHAEFYAALAEELGPQCRNSPDSGTRARLDLEAANLEAALQYAARDGGGELLARLVIGLLDYWFYSGRVHHADRWVQVAGDAELPGQEQARLLLSAGNLAFVEGDLERAQPALARAHAAAVQLGDLVLLARTRAVQAVVDRHAGRLEQALGQVDVALALLRLPLPAAGDDIGGLVASLHNERGELLDELGRPDEALVLLHGFAEWAAQQGGPSRLAQAQANLALHAQESGDDARAQALITAAVDSAARGGAAPVRADVLAVAGLVELRASRPDRAAALLRESAALSHRSGQLLTLADTVSLLGAALLAGSGPAGSGPAGARLLAAGQAWRTARGLAVVGRSARQAIDQAGERLAELVETGQLPADRCAAEQRAGRAVPYGSAVGLQALGVLVEPPSPLAPQPRAVDLRAIRLPRPSVETADPTQLLGLNGG